MFDIQGIYEAHIETSNLNASVDFYTNKLGLKIALEIKDRGAVFVFVDNRETGMIGIWDEASASKPIEMQKNHFAFTVSLAEMMSTTEKLQSVGITPLDFYGNPTDEPDVIGWTPTVNIYFDDPDGHRLEFITILKHEPRPDVGIVKMSEWNKLTQ